MNPSTDFLQKAERSISKPRFDSYRGGGGTDAETLSRYLWNIALCEALYPCLQILEVSFRNAVHEAISKSPIGPNWLMREIRILHASELARIVEAKDSLRRARKPVDEAYLISELSFGFWTSLLDVRYDQLWHKIIAAVFPAMPRTQRTRGEASRRMNIVRKMRNAALHHHSIWHWRDLKQQHAEAHTLIGWICPMAAQVAKALDRFDSIHAGGASPYAQAAKTIIG